MILKTIFRVNTNQGMALQHKYPILICIHPEDGFLKPKHVADNYLN